MLSASRSTFKLLSERERGCGNKIVFTADRLQCASLQTRTNIGAQLFDRGIITINEYRELLYYEPIEDGDVRMVSLNYVKLSPSVKDGSSATNYNTDGTGYIEIPNSTPSGTNGGYIRDMLYTALGMFPTVITGSSSTYYPDGCRFNIAIIAFALFSGTLSEGRHCGAFNVFLDAKADRWGWYIGASLSYK